MAQTDNAPTLLANVKRQLRQFFAYERSALRILVACVLAVIGSSLDPPFLALTSDGVQTALRASESRAPLLISVGYLVLAVVTLVGGTTGDLFGRRRLLLFGLAGIVTTNVLGAFTVGTPLHAPVYVLNVVSTGFVLPMAVAIVTLAFEPAVRPFAFGMVFGAQGASLLLGSTLKWLAQLSGLLGWSFVPVVIVGVLAIWQTARHVPESSAERTVHRTSALLNLALLAVTFLLVFLLLSGRALIGNRWVVVIALGSLGLAGVTARWWLERLSNYLEADIFAGRNLVLAIIAGVVISGVQVAFLFEFGTFSREVQGISPFVANLRLVPYVLGLLVGSVMIQRLTVRFGTPRCIAGGMALMAVSLLSLTLVGRETSYWLMLVPIVIMGYGAGIATPARAQIILSAPPITLVGASAAVNTATGQLGSALGITTSSAIVTRVADAAYLLALQAAGASQTVLDQVRGVLPPFDVRAAEEAYATLPDAVARDAVARIVTLGYADAWTSGLVRLFLGYGIAMLIGAVTVYVVMVRQGRTRTQGAQTATQ